MKPKPRPVKRRRFLKYGLGGLTALTAAGAGLGYWAFDSLAVDTTGSIDFDNELAIPPLAKPQTDSQGRKVFDLRLKHGKTRFKPGAKTKTWGINGDYLGPTLRAARGDEIAINVRNSLGETSSLHWHGMHLPAKMDGGPHQPVAAHDTWTTTWTVDQPAATLWYHPHPHGDTAKHVYRGLVGMFIVDDEKEAELALPRDYGVDDIPLIIQDKQFNDDNSLGESLGTFGDTGILGDEILVNGTHSPYREVSTKRVRLRVLNGSNARVFNLGFADDRSFALIGTDGGLLQAAHRTDRIMVSPGERVELVVEFSPGEKVVLRSTDPPMGTDYFESRPHGGHDRFDILEFRAAARLADSAEVPAELVVVPAIPTDEVAKTRRFKLSGRTINDKKMDMNRIDFGVRKNSVEIWEVVNWDSSVHNFHVHDVQFQILSIGGRKPPPELRGWKDTVYLKPMRDYRLALHFKDFSDPDMPYMHHCHILYHEDNGLMGQFVVLDEGEKIGTVPTGDHGGHHE